MTRSTVRCPVCGWSVGTCELSIYGVPEDVQQAAAQECADAINAARGMVD